MCLLAALGRDEAEETEDQAQAFAGALYLAEAIHDLHLIRRALTDGK